MKRHNTKDDKSTIIREGNCHLNDIIMIFSTRTDGVLLTKDYGIEVVANGEDEVHDFKWYGMLSPVEEILFSDTVLKLIF